MYCPSCGNQTDETAKFCQKCGSSFNKPETTSTSDSVLDQVTFVIDKIKSSGVASIDYWVIAFTKGSIYFCDMGSNFLPLGLGAMVDIVMTPKAKNTIEISSLLSRAKTYYKFDKGMTGDIESKKGFINNKIILQTKARYKTTIKVSNKQYNSFIEQLQNFNN